MKRRQKNQQAADQKGSKDKVKTEVPSESAENLNLETHTQKLEQVPGGSTSSRDTQTLSVAELKVAYAEVRSDKGNQAGDYQCSASARECGWLRPDCG